MAKRYYWLKLKKDFFKDPKIMLLQRKKRGKEILLFYIFLLTESIEREGLVAFDDGQGYTEEELAQLFGSTASLVNLALEALCSSGFVRLKENGVLEMEGFSEMVGSETDKAELMRKSRLKKKNDGNNVTEALPNCYIEKDKEINIEIDKESESKTEEERDESFLADPGRDWTELTPRERVPLTQEELQDIVRKMGPDIACHYLEKLDQFAILKRRYIKDPHGLVLKWYREDYGTAL